MSEFNINDIATTLKKNVDTKGLIDVSAGVEEQFGVTKTKFRLAVDLLKEEGYQVYLRPATQLGTEKKTFVKVLASSESNYKDVYDQTIHPVDKNV
jgi:hypothetical protein